MEDLCKPELSSTSSFFLETQKATTLQQLTGGKTLNLVLKAMLELFFQKNIRISILKRRLRNFYKKEDLKQHIKPMIGNLQN